VILDINNHPQHQPHPQALQNVLRGYPGPGQMHGMSTNSENFNNDYEKFDNNKYTSNLIKDSRGGTLGNHFNQLNLVSQDNQVHTPKTSSQQQPKINNFKDEVENQLNMASLKIDSKMTTNVINKNNIPNSISNPVFNNLSSQIDGYHPQNLQNAQNLNQYDKGNILSYNSPNSNFINQPKNNFYNNNPNALLNLIENERSNYIPKEAVIGQYGLTKTSLFSDDPFKASLFPNLKKSSSSLQNNLRQQMQNQSVNDEETSPSDSNLPISNQNFFNYKNDGSLYSIFNNIQKDSIFDRHKNTYNYFYYKLFDNYGEDLNKINSFDYQNVSKQELFKEDEEEKKKYEILNQIEDDGHESDVGGKQTEDCFGPQKAKPQTKERNFKPY
jgi:hypothetical protein